ncbi:MAG: hypothetical protein MJ150_06300, partial [Clostridia bacterium]|nr:hypothetical protein [Clostridia bacterium]
WRDALFRCDTKEPVYLESSASSLPEVKRVIVYFNDKLAYASTLSEALDELFGEGAGDPLNTAYPIIAGKEMAEELLKEPEPIIPDEPIVDDNPDNPQTPIDKTDKQAIADLIQEITNKLNELQKYLMD